MPIERSQIEEITARLSIVDVIGQYLSLKRVGSSFVALCPFHKEKTPSFHVHPVKNFYYCFGCGASGDMFRFVMEMEKISFPDAVEKLARKAGVVLRESSAATGRATDREAVLEILQRLLRTFRYFLLSEHGKEAREVLRHRKISAEVEEQFQLGFLPHRDTWLWDFLSAKNYPPHILARTGLFIKDSRRTYLEGRLLFPIWNARGEVVSFGGRLLKGEGPKYLNGPETEVFQKRAILYGFYQALPEVRRSKELILTEGYFDVLALFTAGIPWAAAPLGTAVSSEHLELVRRQGLRLKLFFDQDQAGLQSAWKVYCLAEEFQVDCEVIPLPPGCKDPAEVLERHSPRELADWAQAARDPLEVLLPALTEMDLDRHRGLSRSAEMVKQLLDIVPSPIRRESLLEKYAQVARLDLATVKAEMEGRGKSFPVRPHGQHPQPTLQENPDWVLVACLIAHPELYGLFRRQASPEDLPDGELRGILRILDRSYFDTYNSGSIPTQELHELLPEALREDYSHRKKRGDFDLDPIALVRDGVRRIHLRNLQAKKRFIEAQLSRVGSVAEQEELLRDLRYLDEEIIRIRGGAGDGARG